MKKETSHTPARENTHRFSLRRQPSEVPIQANKEKKLRLVHRAAVGLMAIALVALVTMKGVSAVTADPNTWETTHYAACSVQKEFAQAACYADADLRRLKVLAADHKYDGSVYIDFNLRRGEHDIVDAQGQTVDFSSGNPDFSQVDDDLKFLESLDWSDSTNSIFLYLIFVKHPKDIPDMIVTESNVSSYFHKEAYVSNFAQCQIDDGDASPKIFEIGDTQAGAVSKESDGVKQHYFNTHWGPQESFTTDLGHHSLKDFELCDEQFTDYTKSMILAKLANQPLVR